MSYGVKTIYYTIQGEGAQAGRPAVFLRFTGCNLWSGREEDRAKAICQFCDTDFLRTDGPLGGNYACAKELAEVVKNCWLDSTDTDENPYVVCTGGEPLLQLNPRLIDALHDEGFEIAVETNGTRRAPEGIDWICVSPKARAEQNLLSGNELKLVYPQEDLDPAVYLEQDFDHYYLQPLDGDNAQENIEKVLDYTKKHPQWRVSIQMHKVLGID